MSGEPYYFWLGASADAETGSSSLCSPEPLRVSAHSGDDPARWECFIDVGFYDMWCVRPIGERKFGNGFHVIDEQSATGLRDYLNAISAKPPRWRK